MRRDLKGLTNTYIKHIEKSFVTPFSVAVMCKQRRAIYSGTTFPADDVLTESEWFLKYIEAAMLKPSTAFEEMLSYIPFTHEDVENADNETIFRLMGMEKDTLTDVWTVFKKTPLKYGYKIKQIKNVIDNIDKLQEELSGGGEGQLK